MWGKTGLKFITHNGQKISGEATIMVILITDGVGKGNLGMVITFCHHDQVKMEASDAFSALCQCGSPKPSMVVMRRYTNTSYIPQGTSCFLYLDMSILSGGPSSTQFPLDWLHLCRLMLCKAVLALSILDILFFIWNVSRGIVLYFFICTELT